jgi:hypothetical protein
MEPVRRSCAPGHQPRPVDVADSELLDRNLERGALIWRKDVPEEPRRRRSDLNDFPASQLWGWSQGSGIFTQNGSLVRGSNSDAASQRLVVFGFVAATRPRQRPKEGSHFNIGDRAADARRHCGAIGLWALLRLPLQERCTPPTAS